MEYSDFPYIVEPMRDEDVAQVMEIEQVSFSSPWPASAYQYELKNNSNAFYFVLRERGRVPPLPQPEARPPGGLWARLFGRDSKPLALPRRPVLGYGGFWLMAGEAHISTIAVRPDLRRRGLGEVLLIAMLERAMELHATFVTLEVRASNKIAQALYRKYAFQDVGLRPHYYSDNGEDAILMSTEPLVSPTFQRHLQARRVALRQRFSQAADAPATPRPPTNTSRPTPENVLRE